MLGLNHTISASMAGTAHHVTTHTPQHDFWMVLRLFYVTFHKTAELVWLVVVKLLFFWDVYYILNTLSELCWSIDLAMGLTRAEHGNLMKLIFYDLLKLFYLWVNRLNYLWAISLLRWYIIAYPLRSKL